MTVEALLAVVGTLIVLLLGWLHVRVSEISRKSKDLYEHLDRHFVRKDAYEANKDHLLSAIQSLNQRLDRILDHLTNPDRKDRP